MTNRTLADVVLRVGIVLILSTPFLCAQDLEDVVRWLEFTSLKVETGWLPDGRAVGKVGPIAIELSPARVAQEPFDKELQGAVYANPTSASLRLQYAEELKNHDRPGEAFVHYQLATSLYAQEWAQDPEDEAILLGYVRSLVGTGSRQKAQELLLPLISDEDADVNWEALSVSLTTIRVEEVVNATFITRDAGPILRAVEPMREPFERALREWNGEIIRSNDELIHWPFIVKSLITMARSWDERLQSLPGFDDSLTLFGATQDYIKKLETAGSAAPEGPLITATIELVALAVDVVLRDPDGFAACFVGPHQAIVDRLKEIQSVVDDLPDAPSSAQVIEAVLTMRDQLSEVWPLVNESVLRVDAQLGALLLDLLTDAEKAAIVDIRRRVEGFGNDGRPRVAVLAFSYAMEGDVLAAAHVVASNITFAGALRELTDLIWSIPRDAEDAVRALENGAWDAEHAFTHAVLGVAFFSLGHPDEAVRQYALADSMSPENSEILTELGVAMVTAGRTTVQAEQALMRALELDPRSFRAEAALAVHRARQDRWEDAINHALRATLLNPSAGDAHLSEGVLLALYAERLEAVQDPRAADFARQAYERCLAGAALFQVPRPGWDESDGRNAASVTLQVAAQLEEDYGDSLDLSLDDVVRSLSLAWSLVEDDGRGALAIEIDERLSPHHAAELLTFTAKRLLVEAWIAGAGGASEDDIVALAEGAVIDSRRADASCLFTLSNALDQAGRLDLALGASREGVAVTERRDPLHSREQKVRFNPSPGSNWSVHHDRHLARLDRAVAGAQQRGDVDQAGALEREWVDLVARREGLEALEGEGLVAWGHRQFRGDVEATVNTDELERILARARAEGTDDPGVCVVLAMYDFEGGRLQSAVTLIERVFHLTASSEPSDIISRVDKVAYELADDLTVPARAIGDRVLLERVRSAQLGLLARAVVREPDDGQWHRLTGWIYHEQGRNADAVVELRRATELDPNDAAAFWMLGRSLTSEGDDKAAVAAYEQAVSIDSDWALAHASLGALLLKTEDPEGAVVALSRAVELTPDQLGVRTDLGRAHTLAGDVAAAVAAFEHTLTIEPEYPAAHFYLGLLAIDRADLVAAAASMSRVLEIEPSNRPALDVLLTVQIERGEIDAGFAALDAIVQRRPRELGLRLARVDFALAVGSFDRATRELVESRSLDESVDWQFEVSNRLLMVHRTQSDRAAEFNELERRVVFAEEFVDVWAFLAASHLELAKDDPLYNGERMLQAALKAAALSNRVDAAVLALLFDVAVSLEDDTTARQALADLRRLEGRSDGDRGAWLQDADVRLAELVAPSK